jgi:DNA-binding winged helix-turn-helix (wHTH) protein
MRGSRAGETSMNQAASSRSVVRFGPYELDRQSAELRKNGIKIRLQEQPFQILVALLEHPGEVILREEIRQKLWPDDTMVEFDHRINAAIKRLRDALSETAEKPRYVETVARRGYRFIGKLGEEPSEPGKVLNGQPEGVAPAIESVAKPNVTHDGPRTALLRPPAYLVVTVIAVLGGTLASTWYRHVTAPARWAHEVALPEAARLVESGKYTATFHFSITPKRFFRAIQPSTNYVVRSHFPLRSLPPRLAPTFTLNPTAVRIASGSVLACLPSRTIYCRWVITGGK